MKARKELRLWLVGRQRGRWLHRGEGLGWGEASKGGNVCGVGAVKKGEQSPGRSEGGVKATADQLESVVVPLLSRV